MKDINESPYQSTMAAEAESPPPSPFKPSPIPGFVTESVERYSRLLSLAPPTKLMAHVSWLHEKLRAAIPVELADAHAMVAKYAIASRDQKFSMFAAARMADIYTTTKFTHPASTDYASMERFYLEASLDLIGALKEPQEKEPFSIEVSNLLDSLAKTMATANNEQLDGYLVWLGTWVAGYNALHEEGELSPPRRESSLICSAAMSTADLLNTLSLLADADREVGEFCRAAIAAFTN